MLLVPEEEWRNLHDTQEQIIDLITRRNADDSNNEWIESDEAARYSVFPQRRGRTTATNASFPSPKLAAKSTSTALTSTPSSASTELNIENSNPTYDNRLCFTT